MHLIVQQIRNLIDPPDPDGMHAWSSKKLLDTTLQKVLFWISFTILALITFLLNMLGILFASSLTTLIIGSVWLCMLLGYFFARYLKEKLRMEKLGFVTFFIFLIFPYLPLIIIFNNLPKQ